jgi:hypothetical protein
MTPEFPIRIITDDGECEEIDSPEELLERVDTIDSTDRAARIWVRDALDRTVTLRMRGGVVEELSASEASG